MRILWDGREYQYDPRGIDIKAAVTIKLFTGHGLLSWENAVLDLDPQALAALLWVVKRQNGEVCDPASLNFSALDFFEAYKAAAIAEKKEGSADPTTGPAAQDPASDPPTPASTPTSDGLEVTTSSS